MIQRLTVHCPLNGLSLGQVSFNLLREFYKRKIQVTLFPYGQPDFSPYKVDQQFGEWLQRSINTRYTKLDRNVPSLALWHINGSELKYSDKQYLFTFHETDSPTDTEVNIVNQQDFTFFSSSWSVNNFKQFGSPVVGFVPLGLDEDFTPAGHRLIADDYTHWILVGKAEQRKNTELIIRTWIKRYGIKREHKLTLCITNPFFKPEQMNAFLHGVFNGKKPDNVNVLPILRTNVEMNQLYNSADIDLSGFSSSEGWNIPAHTATALGKWSIVTNCTAHKDWATAENSILVDAPTSREVYDGMFFRKGELFSQGNVYSLTLEQLEEAMIVAEKLAKTPNPAGEKLRAEHTYAKTVDAILNKIGD